ncbi:UDP-glycosyltransferase 85A2 [Morella rubra]|uniref:UDP-glycosyltransferase 85A2 n=1 Tax=Morella rubra TaxID=262757 RepID=A0A6A1V4N2_9ROSI|nr:UDP-glycosyltransferase 85A2 [Morella rubra]
MLKLAKLLNQKGFHVTFVNFKYNHKRLLRSRGPNSLDGFPNFHFEAIPDGLPPSDANVSQDVPALCQSTSTTCLVPFRNLLSKLNDTSSSKVLPVTYVISDGYMTFTPEAAETPSASGVLGYMHCRHLVERGLIPLKDASDLINGYLETALDWILGMKNIRLKDRPNFVWTTDENDIMINFLIREAERSPRGSAFVLNTFEPFEQDVLDGLSSLLPCIYTVGPLLLLVDQIKDDKLKSIGSNLWKEEPGPDLVILYLLNLSAKQKIEVDAAPAVLPPSKSIKKRVSCEVDRSGDLVSYCVEERVRIFGEGKFLVSNSFPGNERTKYCLTSKILLGEKHEFFGVAVMLTSCCPCCKVAVIVGAAVQFLEKHDLFWSCCHMLLSSSWNLELKKYEDAFFSCCKFGIDVHFNCCELRVFM